MESSSLSLTVYFEDPFWVGLFQRTEGSRLEVCKITFGAEPRDAEVWAFVLTGFWGLRFSPPVPADRAQGAPNPKRARREAAARLEDRGPSTKAQRALQLQYEAGKAARETARCARDEAEEERRFRLRQAKKKEKRRGH